MIDDVGVRVGLDGRVVRHKVGDVRPRAHRYAELEVNLVVRGTASYLLGDRRYALTPGKSQVSMPFAAVLLVACAAGVYLAVGRPQSQTWR